MKIYKTLLCDLNVFKGSSSRICFCNGNNPCTSEDTHTEELSSNVVEKDEHNLHEHDVNIFNDDEDGRITVSG